MQNSKMIRMECYHTLYSKRDIDFVKLSTTIIVRIFSYFSRGDDGLRKSN